MHSSGFLAVLALGGAVVAAPTEVRIDDRVERSVEGRATACFIIGSTALPAEVQDTVTAVQNAVTCDTSKTTLSGVPDVIASDGTSFSSIDFSKSASTPLEFALSKFATDATLANTNLSLFQNQLNTYLATEAGIRSVGGNLAIKAPKFFQSFQIARINTAQGTAIADPGQSVEHLLAKVIKNAGSTETQATKDQITALASVLT